MKKIILFLILVACASDEKKLYSDFDADAYQSLIKKYSAEAQHYNGIMNVFSMNGTIINSKVQMEIIFKSAYDFQWTEQEYNKKRNEALDERKEGAKVFLSFFTPQYKHDDLNDGNSIWRVYLEANGKRYDGKIIKRTDKFDELKTYYPNHNRWSTPYEVIFKIPLQELDNADSTLTLTGPLGTESLNFNKLE